MCFLIPTARASGSSRFRERILLKETVDSSKSLGILAHRTWEWWIMEPKYLAFRFGDWIHPNHHHLTFGETFGSLGNPGWHQITPLHHTFASSKINPLPTLLTILMKKPPLPYNNRPKTTPIWHKKKHFHTAIYYLSYFVLFSKSPHGLHQFLLKNTFLEPFFLNPYTVKPQPTLPPRSPTGPGPSAAPPAAARGWPWHRLRAQSIPRR